MNNRAVELLSSYEIDAEQFLKGRGSFLISSKQGDFILKEYKGPVDKLCALDRVLSRMDQSDNCHVERLIKTKDEQYFLHDKDFTRCILKTYKTGRECNIQNKDDCIKAVKYLAQFHNEIESMMPDINNMEEKVHIPVYDICTEYRKHNNELKKIRQYLQRKSQKTDFEISLLKNFDSFYKSALDTLDAVVYYRNVFVDNCNKILCHGDYQHHNIIFSQDDIFLINFEKCIFDDPVRDLYLFMRKLMEKNNWSVELGMDMENAYESVRPLSLSSKINLYYRFQYPEKFWKIANFYYNNTKSWIPGKNMDKLNHLFLQERNKKIFLEQAILGTEPVKQNKE